MAIAHNYGYDGCKSDFDTPTFTSSSMCCACGGGQTIPPTSETCEHAPPTHLDIEGDTCTHYRKYHLGTRCDGTYDDSDFTASEMCCGCGGGLKLCANTNHDLVDAAGNTCSSYLTPDECDGQHDTATFTAEELCCSCGGGFQWLPSTIPTAPALECVDTTPDQDTSCSQREQNSSTCGMYVCLHPSSLFSFFPPQNNVSNSIKTKQVRHPRLQLLKAVLCMWWRRATPSRGYLCQ